MLDSTDKLILHILQSEGRISNAELARRVNLSPPATHARLRRLEEQGIIHHYAALLDRETAGFDMLCFVQISLVLHQPEQVEAVRVAIRQMPEVLECHHVTGEYDYLLKVVIHNRKDLERFVLERLTPIPGVARIHTSLVLTEVKSTTALPVD
ncbi:MAG: AsnC family transcriptional regulator [Chloroflexi bacterium RBG_16_54_18]|nr:MAG: AsnC family transcriptional regulator [Chloroflexi bacterium RBG_16_54_18]